MAEELTLKWGTIKGWSGLTEKSQEFVRRYFADTPSISAMADRPDESQRAILCELIDQLDGEIWNDWDGIKMTKDEAKRYVTEYGQRS